MPGGRLCDAICAVLTGWVLRVNAYSDHQDSDCRLYDALVCSWYG